MTSRERPWWRRWSRTRVRSDVFDAFLTDLLRTDARTIQRSDVGLQTPEEQAARRIVDLTHRADLGMSRHTDADKERIRRQVMAFASDSAPRSHAAGSHARHQAPDRAAHQGSESIYRVDGRLAWVNGLVAAVLLVSIGAGGALTGQRLMGDDGGQQPTMQAAMSQEGIRVAGTPAATGLEPATVPTPEECTVEPLTVDDVIAIVRNPYAYSLETYGNAGSPVPAGPGNPAITGVVPDEEMADIVALQRLWMACAIKGSLFQQWALETPDRVALYVRDALPAFASEADARKFLTGLEGTTEDMLPLDDPLGVFWLINPDPSAAYYDGNVGSQSRTIFVPYTEYDREGKPMWTTTLDPRNVISRDGTWVFLRMSDTSPWLIQDIGIDAWNMW